ncbi:hypothetical protein [Nostoc sp. UHCC 0870]
MFLFSKYIFSTAEADKTTGRCLMVAGSLFIKQTILTASSTYLRKS